MKEEAHSFHNDEGTRKPKRSKSEEAPAWDLFGDTPRFIAAGLRLRPELTLAHMASTLGGLSGPFARMTGFLGEYHHPAVPMVLAVRHPGRARQIYKHGFINVMLMTTSNGMTVSPDIADRSVEIGIRKRPPDYSFTQWPEGNIFRHIEANRARYLATIYGAIQYWVDAGMPGGSTTGLRFAEWESAVSWIVEQVLPEKALRLFPQGRAGRVTAAERMSTADFDLLTEICRTLDATGYAGQELTAAAIVKICGDSIDCGGDDPVKAARKLGMTLGSYFRDGKQMKNVGDGFRIDLKKKNVNGRATPHYTVCRADEHAVGS